MSSSNSEPETRLSLLLRVGDPADQAAWEEFARLYHPVIYRTARYKGLQDADALDVTQKVLISVGKARGERPHDPNRAKFRTWLTTVTRNAAINALQSRQAVQISGDSAVQRSLAQVPDRSSDEEILEREYQKQVFRIAARRVEPEFAKDTWAAFWLSTVEEQPIDVVAEKLGKKIGSIYAARSRIIRRLKEEIQNSPDFF